MPKTSKRIKVAVIGAGNMGKNHLRNYFLLPDADLVALSDINPAAKELADEYSASFFTDYKEMLDTVKPEAVSIVVPTPLHAQIATEVISRGIHILLEKPIASTIEEADALIELAVKNKVVFTVGHIEHYNPLITRLKELLDEGAIGEVTSVICKRVGGFPAVEPKTDVVLDLAIHDIGIISFLLGKQPKKIAAHGSRTYHSTKIDSAEILLDYGRASGFIQANWITPVKIRTIAVTGSTGYIEGNYVTQELELHRHEMTKIPNDFSGFMMNMKTQDKEVMKVDFEEPLAKELKSFLSRINNDMLVALVSPQEARDALDLAIQSVSKYNED